MPQRKPIAIVKPLKPVGEMTDEEYEAWADALAERLFAGLHGEASDEPPAEADGAVRNA